MATSIYTTRVKRAPSPLNTVSETASAFFAGIRDGLRMYDAYHALARLSDAELRKRGLTRSEISRAVALGRVRD
jgi:uncharacterized protein YjiS (DUF1127 family)